MMGESDPLRRTSVGRLRTADSESASALVTIPNSRVATLLTGNADARVADGVAWVQALSEDLTVPGFATYGMSKRDVPDILVKAMASSSMKGNPITLTESELSEVLMQAF
jgi:alcohol dehydrogenase class IV